MQKDKNRLIISVLIIIILVLLGIILYSFVVKPSLNGYVIQKQLEAQDITLNTLVSQVQQKGYAEIFIGNNQSLILVPYTGPTSPVAQSS